MQDAVNSSWQSTLEIFQTVLLEIEKDRLQWSDIYNIQAIITRERLLKFAVCTEPYRRPSVRMCCRHNSPLLLCLFVRYAWSINIIADNHIFIQFKFFRGIFNVQADKISRMFLSEQTFSDTFLLFQQQQIEIQFPKVQVALSYYSTCQWSRSVWYQTYGHLVLWCHPFYLSACAHMFIPSDQAWRNV